MELTTEQKMSKEPETTFEFIHGYMKRAIENCRVQGKKDSALLWSDSLQHLEYQQSRIAELEQQVAELSKDKERLDGLIKIMSTENGDYFGFESDDDMWHLVRYDDISRWSISAGKSQIEAIDAAIAKEQENES